jgi:16S rRNA (adenine1518-N6/adenine1519-N6)-dimethyltransferase
VVTAAFSQRRKTVGNSLGTLIGRDTLAELGIDVRVRAENLSLGDYVRIAKAAVKNLRT